MKLVDAGVGGVSLGVDQGRIVNRLVATDMIPFVQGPGLNAGDPAGLQRGLSMVAQLQVDGRRVDSNDLPEQLPVSSMSPFSAQ